MATACNIKTKLGYDDSLDVVGVHGVGGTWGALATGLFATKLVNDGGGDGLFYGNPKQLGIQLVAVLVTWGLALVMTTIILKVLDAIMGTAVAFGFDEVETTMRVARNAWSNALACAVGASVGRWGTLRGRRGLRAARLVQEAVLSTRE